MDTDNKNLQAMQEKIEQVNQQIDLFQTKVEKIPATVDSEYNTIINELKIKKARLENKIDTINGATDSAYKDLQIGVKMAWEDLNMAYESAKERFDSAAL